MRLGEIKKQFVLVMGGAGSGKNYFIETHAPFYHFKLIDIDSVKGKLGLNAGMASIKPAMIAAFERGENVAHPTTGSHLKGQQNKIDLAHQYGYHVTLILIDTPINQAVAQVRNRHRQGGHDVALDVIVSSNKKARENFTALQSLADESKVV